MADVQGAGSARAVDTSVAGLRLPVLSGAAVSDSYADAPVSLAETKAEKLRDASLWKPRDALIALLRDIDNGADIPTMVVVYRSIVDGQKGIFYQAAGSTDKIETLGMLARISHIIAEQQ